MGLKIGKRTWISVIVISVLAGAFFFFRFQNGDVAFKAEQKIPDAVKLKLYQAKNPPFNFTFEYPESWRTREIGFKGQYDMAQILGPQDKKTGSVPAAFIVLKPLQGQETLSQLSESLLSDEKRFPKFKTLQKKDILISGQKALQLKYQYAFLLPFKSQNAKETLVKRTQVFILYGKQSYQITFAGTDEQFNVFGPIFEHVLETFKFLD